MNTNACKPGKQKLLPAEGLCSRNSSHGQVSRSANPSSKKQLVQLHHTDKNDQLSALEINQSKSHLERWALETPRNFRQERGTGGSQGCCHLPLWATRRSCPGGAGLRTGSCGFPGAGAASLDSEQQRGPCPVGVLWQGWVSREGRGPLAQAAGQSHACSRWRHNQQMKSKTATRSQPTGKLRMLQRRCKGPGGT